MCLFLIFEFTTTIKNKYMKYSGGSLLLDSYETNIQSVTRFGTYSLQENNTVQYDNIYGITGSTDYSDAEFYTPMWDDSFELIGVLNSPAASGHIFALAHYGTMNSSASYWNNYFAIWVSEFGVGDWVQVGDINGWKQANSGTPNNIDFGPAPSAFQYIGVVVADYGSPADVCIDCVTVENALGTSTLTVNGRDLSDDVLNVNFWIDDVNLGPTDTSIVVPNGYHSIQVDDQAAWGGVLFFYRLEYGSTYYFTKPQNISVSSDSTIIARYQ